jgi:hypothetical protein
VHIYLINEDAEKQFSDKFISAHSRSALLFQKWNFGVFRNEAFLKDDIRHGMEKERTKGRDFSSGYQ